MVTLLFTPVLVLWNKTGCFVYLGERLRNNVMLHISYMKLYLIKIVKKVNNEHMKNTNELSQEN